MVLHKVFGEGQVKETSGEYITVNFQEQGDKKFVYPDAFERFLKVEDSQLNEVITHDLSVKEEEIEKEREVIRLKFEEEQLEREKEKKVVKKKTTTRKTTKAKAKPKATKPKVKEA